MTRPRARRAARTADISRDLTPGDRFIQDTSDRRGELKSIGYIAFLVYIIVITTYRINIGDIAVATALGGVILQAKNPRFPPVLAAFAAMFAWCALGYVQTGYPAYVEEEVINLGKLGLILFAGVNVIRTRTQLRWFLVVWLGAYALYPMRGALFNFFLGGYTVWGRAVWNFIYRNPNDLAALTLLQLGICAGVLVSDKWIWFRRAALLGIVLLSLVIMITQSRAGILGLGAFGLLALAGHRKKGQAVAVAAIALVVAILFAPSSVWDRMGALIGTRDVEQLGELEDMGSAEQRFDIWRTAVDIIGDHPAFGVGWGAYPAANAYYAPAEGGAEVELGARDAHSTYLRTIAEIGFPGFLLFALLIGITVWKAERERRANGRLFPRASQQIYLLELGLLAFLVAGIFGSFSRLAHLYLYLITLWVSAHMLAEDRRRFLRATATPPTPVAQSARLLQSNPADTQSP